MKLKTQYLSFIACAISLTIWVGCTSEKQRLVKIQGEINGLKSEKVILLDPYFQPVDTVISREGHFEFAIQAREDGPVYREIYIPSLGNLNYSQTRNRIGFFTDGKVVVLKAGIDKGSLQHIEVSGSPAYEEMNLLDKNFPASIAIDRYSEEYNAAFKAYNEVEQSEENRKRLNYYSAIIDSLFKVKRENIIAAIDHNKNSTALSFIVYNNFRNEPAGFLKDIINRFSPSAQKRFYLKALNDKVKLQEASDVGAAAPDFSLETSEGKQLQLSSFRGKFVLMDFWASWCGPCKKEIPNVIENYKRFKDNGLEVLAISIDDSEEKWEKGMAEANMPYHQLLDRNKHTMDIYQYRGIPYMVLVDPKGVIIAKGDALRGEALEKTLNKFLKE